jgi:transposase
MTIIRKPYKTYTKNLSWKSLRLMEKSDRPASEIAMRLGIRRNQLYKWKEDMKKTGDVPTAKKAGPGKRVSQR